jgi:flavin-dependent dehydrogenase
MDACDVLIVGGGPAGSSCAWALRGSGLKVAILDRRAFPRDKVCGGWITPAVLEELQIDAAEYARGRVFQPITGFLTSTVPTCFSPSAVAKGRQNKDRASIRKFGTDSWDGASSIGGPEVRTDYSAPVSYGIRRFEFDEFLLRRCGARTLDAAPLASCEPTRSGWMVNGHIETRLLVGAGGHFCPVARLLGADARQEVAVAAQEAEFELDAAQRASCPIQGEIPELYFCRDMKGYGWCFRKQNFLNIGLGRLDQRELPAHVAAFTEFLKRIGRLPFDLPACPPGRAAMRGHAYLIYRKAARKFISDNVLLIGDAAGLAYSQSGEGIRPAIESGLLAARAILAAQGDYSEARLGAFRDLLRERFGKSGRFQAGSLRSLRAQPALDCGGPRRFAFSAARGEGNAFEVSNILTAIGGALPSGMMAAAAATLLRSRWFTRHVVLDSWFLHRHTPALSPAA